MEDFISEIYHESLIIENFKEFICLIGSGQLHKARSLYNDTAKMLEDLLVSISKTDTAAACRIQSIALGIKEEYEDNSNAAGLIEGSLIPELYKNLSAKNKISVSDGKYTLLSSDTGFLTAIDNETEKYMHSSYDPMWEAYRIARSVYNPEMEYFMILGCGLGYLAYQIFSLSEGAVEIQVFEDDPCILEYAYLYGVLSLIPDENIRIIHDIDKEALGKEFINSLNSTGSGEFYISSFKRQLYNGVCNGTLNRIMVNHDFDLETRNLSAINFWKNKKLDRIDISDLVRKFRYDEWIIISAGPSLDCSISFLKENKGKKGLIAVNTVFRRLLNEGIVPDMIAAADQFPELLEHIRGIEDSTKDITLIADWLLNWKYSYAYQGEICFVRTNASVDVAREYVPNDPVWDISGTVAALAIETAVCNNAKKIYLVGQDLAYPDGQRYAKDMPHGDERAKRSENQNALQVLSVDGRMVDTCEAFVWFKKSLEYQIKKYHHIEFFNMSRHGANIEGTIPL